MEPSLSWGLRMAVATVTPVVWGIATKHEAAGEWMALSADCICWVALKGTYAQRLRILIGGIALTMLFALLGSITGKSLPLSIGCMLFVAFLAGLFKNLGERGSGLSLCVYIMFLVANAHPVSGKALDERLFFILIGGIWNAALALLAIFFLPEQQPYRRSISLIWRAAAALAQQVGKGWDGKGTRSSQRDIYLAERDIRAALDTSFAFHERTASQLAGKGKTSTEYQLAQSRKSAALVAAHLTAIAGELEDIRLNSIDEALRIRLSKLLRGLRRSAGRIAVFVFSRRSEDELLVREALDGTRRQLAALEAHQAAESLALARVIRRVILLGNRSLRLMEHSLDLLSSVTETRVFRAYPVLKTIYVLHPRHWWRSIRILFNVDSHTARYAVRTAIASTLAMSIYKWFRIDHGYWLPFTVIIVMQPYFVATFRKAIDRLIGTIGGGIAGGLLLLLPAGLHMKEMMLAASAIAMVHFFRVQYRVSAFFITLNLVLLLSVSQELDQHIILLRAAVTLLGALIAIVAGFLLLPNWDRDWLPRLLAQAVERNRSYFLFTFSENDPADGANWTRCKRQAEVSNSNAFDSFNRAMQEPGGIKKAFALYYQLITHNVRITRELNNIHLEEEDKGDTPQPGLPDAQTTAAIEACASYFTEIMLLIATLSKKPMKAADTFPLPSAAPTLNTAQKLYLSRLQTELRQLLDNLRDLTGHRAPAIPTVAA